MRLRVLEFWGKLRHYKAPTYNFDQPNVPIDTLNTSKYKAKRVFCCSLRGLMVSSKAYSVGC